MIEKICDVFSQDVDWIHMRFVQIVSGLEL